MDRRPSAAAGGKEGSSVEIEWTNEKHATYLHSLEVSFVTRVFRSSAADQFQYYHLNGYDYHHQPLDRHLPDSCDSTLDSTTLDLNHAKQYRDADSHHSKDKRSKKWKKRRTSLVQKASQKRSPLKASPVQALAMEAHLRTQNLLNPLQLKPYRSIF